MPRRYRTHSLKSSAEIITADQNGLHGEIQLLRKFMRDVLAKAYMAEELSDVIDVLEVYGKSSTRLATLLKTEQSLGQNETAGQVINQILAEVVAELEGKGL